MSRGLQTAFMAMHLLSRALALSGTSRSTAAISTLTAAVQTVPADSSTSGVNYFPYETQQLTKQSLANVSAYLASLNATYVDNFRFGDVDAAAASTSTGKTCKLMPADAAWPSESLWSLFNDLLGDRLIEGVPAAAVCYENWPQYDEAKCAEVKNSWTDPAWMSEQPTGVDWPINEGMSCLAPGLGDYLSRDNSTCTMGGLSQYIVNVTNVAQIQLAINFARNQNVRLVVRNTGHDFNAKSTGAGALSIWTHYLNDIQYLGDNYQSQNGYSGPAFKVGAGVSVEQMYKAADARGLMVVGGIARTVGISGGYIAGGGNGPLVNTYSMAADQVVSMEVVLPDGTFVSVDEENNPDLFFAMRGGGGSTWGIVTSVVMRAYQNVKITALTYSFGSGVDEETFWSGMDAFWSYFPTWPEAGVWNYFSISCTDTVDCSMSMEPQLGINMTRAELETEMSPFFAELDALGIDVNATYTEYERYLDMFEGLWPPSTSTCSYWYFHSTSRLFPRSNWDDAATLARQSAAIRNTTQARGSFIGYNSRPAANPRVSQDNAVNPAWRAALLFGQTNVVYGADYGARDIAAANEEMVAALQAWRDVTPGTYLNEADVNEPDWQRSFYGDNYAALYATKQRYDPWGVFYAVGAVGSEDWYTTGQIEYYPTTNGRLCPA